MRLIAFSVEGYRRFVEKTSVKLHSDLVAFVGPNEAGKSSLLRALAHLHSDSPFETNEHPRRTSVRPRLSWHFQLDHDDRASLADLPDARNVERAIVTKGRDGKRSWDFEPRQPRRDRSERTTVLQLLDHHRDGQMFQVANDEGGAEFNLGDFDKVRETLDADVENYGDGHLEGMLDLARRIRLIANPVAAEPGVEEEEEAADVAERREAFDRERDSIAAALESVAASEAILSPMRQAVAALEPRLPSVEFFKDADRELASEYDLDDVAADPPAALNHLASLAGLDLPKLRDEAAAIAIADVATRRNAANKVLREAFDQSWNQQGIAIQVDVQGSILHIQATTPEDEGLSDINERSDGMRWFAALLAFAHGWTNEPILLVDEIEKHLHYDAQADLIGVLSKQQFTSKVIYTTHSFGCLPYDLGSGVRVVQPIDAATSRLENGFWKSGAGFSPLLASMGAAAMSFTPTRHALIGEGAGDAILLPTLLRQASGVDRLDFQVAPGLSSVAAASVPDLEAEAGRVGFIVDGDTGGRVILDKLRTAGVARDRIIVLNGKGDGSEPLEVEDLVDAEIYARAVNDELRCWNKLVNEVSAAELGDSLRTKALDSWCARRRLASPDKAAVAQRVVDRSTDVDVVAKDRRALLKRTFTKARKILKLS